MKSPSQLDCPAADVFAVVDSFEMDVAEGFVGAFLSGGDGVAECGDAKDPAAVGEDLVAFLFGAAVEDLDIAHAGGGGEAGDGEAGGIFAGVAVAGGDDAEGGARVPLERDILEAALDDGEHHFEQIALETHHEGLGFGIAEAAIEFENFGAVGGEHHAGVEDAFVFDVVTDEAINEGDENFALDLGEDGVGDNWGG